MALTNKQIELLGSWMWLRAENAADIASADLFVEVDGTNYYRRMEVDPRDPNGAAFNYEDVANAYARETRKMLEGQHGERLADTSELHDIGILPMEDVDDTNLASHPWDKADTIAALKRLRLKE